MTSKAEQEQVKKPIRVTFHAARAVLLVLVVIAAMFALAERAEAKDVPTQLVIWTDKIVYTDGWYDGATHAEGKGYDRNLAVTVYAVVVDDDGNLMRGRTIGGLLNATNQWDHTQKATDAYHHAINPTSLYRNISLSFSDGGTGGDFKANDGIYVVYSDVAELPAGFVDDHLLINISVNVSGTQLKKFTEVLFTKGRCHKTATNTHPSSTHVGDADPCTICHAGYEHQFDSLPETKGLRSFHVGKITPVDKSLPGKVTAFNYNLSKNDATWVDVSWGTNSPGSEYCNTCHYKSGSGTGHNWWDYSITAAGDDASERPSCAWATAASGASCHASTNITQSSLINIEWTWKQKGPSNSTSHNHTENKANVSCDICHSNYHVIKPFPNTTNREINAQCVLCHNITGGLNITANGGTNVAHDGKTDCKACHMDSSTKLDSHLVPTAGIPGANCTECHDLGGKAPYHIDYNTFNKSDYVHNKYNVSLGKYPLNFNASNGSALRPAENKICWGCHGDDPNNDGKANFSEQPASDHPTKYKNPRTCEQCHQNASSPWAVLGKAPQNVAHSYNNSAGVLTPGAPECYDCHGQPANYNNSNQDPDYNTSRTKGLKATLANHYGTGFPALEGIRGTDGYCIEYCHQNTNSPFEEEFSNKDNMQRPNHSARTSRPDNQSCVAGQCHAASELHGSDMRKPTLASGAFNNTACTASGCHNVSDPPYIDYKNHNAKVNCTSCHMDNIGPNIHPIKYLQENGDFAQVNTTAADCNLCHKENTVDSILQDWGVSPKKVSSQHHSNDPENGSKWNKTTTPYWEYVPFEVTFVNGWKNNTGVDGKVRGYIDNFAAMQDTNYSAATISENTTADAYMGSHPPNKNFTSSASGWSASGVATTMAWSGLAGDGNPAGGITVASTTKSQVVDANWTASFTYPRSGAVAEGIIKLDSKLVKAASINTAALKVVNVSINDNVGNVTEVYNRSLSNTAEPDWIDSGEVSIPNPNTVFWKNGNYNVTIRTRWTGLGGGSTPDIKLAYDNVFVNISEVDYKKYNFTLYINNTAPSDRYQLIVGYQTHTEPAKLYVLNGSSFQYRAALDSGAFTKAIIPLSQQEYGTGNVTLRINDSSGANDVDVRRDYIDIEYMFIESYRWVNNSRVHYPCEYCHAANKHYEHALGIPYEFKGNNYEGQDVNATTSWCASCHWQGYSSGTKNYNNTVQAFKNHSLPVPPEITGNATYGANQSNPAYKNHSVWGKDDLSCWGCHKGKLADGSNSTVFLHNLSTGTSGGRNCTACHNIGGSAKNVNFTSINKSMHANLNKNATGNATNKPCWACHGTKNGSFANESDQPLNEHNGTVYNKPRKCENCHNDTAAQFNGKPVTDHIPFGLSPNTDVNTSKYNKTYCSYCHNNSIGASSDPDGMGITSAMNASSSHYGANKTKGLLMTAANNTTDCVFCHKNTSNMAKWGILNSSLSNISNKNGTANTGFNHNPYTQSSGCYSCHGGSVANFHVSAMSPGEKGNPDCASCHNVSSPGSYAKVDFVAINQSAHGSLNNKSTSNAGNITNKPCWGCHGTMNGSYANQSDQPSNDHNNTYKSSPRKCEDCHINGSVRFNAPGLTEHIMPGKNASTEINVTDGYCTVCHNNSITSNSDNDGMGILSVINASSAHYAKDANTNLMTTVQHSDNCTYCHYVNNGSSAWLTPKKPLTSTHSSYSNSTSPSICWGCHVDSQGEPSTFHVQAINKGAGSGPNCRSCHNTSDSGTTKGHIDGNVFDTSIHGNMNTTAGADLNEPCWGCHGDGNQPASHSANYRSPYVCADCHVSTGVRYSWAVARGALNVSEHFTNGSEIKASYNATALYSCLKCHQDIGEMRLNNSDSDYNITAWASGGDNYNVTIGGNNSPYHYGRKRSDMRNGTSANCTYCHQNSSTAFASVMQNPTVNKSIYEHTDNGTRNVTGRACTDSGCHAAGYIHNSTLAKPVVSNWTQGKYDYCAPCHREAGISTKKVRGHNTSNISTPGMDCGYCHNASSQGAISSGALRIHSTRLTNKSTVNSTCVTCHRDGNYVPANRIINTHYPGTTTDKGNTSESNRSCELCHGEVGTNKLHQSMVKKPVYDCQSCHLNGSKTSPYNATTTKASINAFQHDNASHAPGNQTNCERCHNTTSRQEIFHFTNYANGTSVAPGWALWNNGTQANCIDCHRNKTNQAPFYALYSASETHVTATLDGCYNCHSGVLTYASNPKALHSVEQAPGSANCTLCHDLGGEASKKIDVSAMNKSDSIHLNLNRNATVVKAVQPYANESKRCWACHGNGSEPSGHPTNYKNSYKCADCHVTSGSRNTNYTPNNTILLVTEHYRNGSEIKTPAASYCTNCHNKTEMLKANSDTALSAVNPTNDSVSHYGKNRSGMRSGVNTSCSYCHQNSTTAFENVMLGISNKSIYEHTDAGTKNTSAGSCTGSKCHSQGFIHNSTLTKPAVQNWTQGGKDYCAPCHKVSDTNATKYVYAHNTSNISNPGMDCGYCHNASSQGAVSSGALKLHTSNLTNTSTSNSTCVACHRDTKYVTSSRVIKTHYPNASQGKANTSKSAWDCEECHGWSTGTKMHNQSLIKKPNYDCNACHNASGASPYKANATPFVNITRHDNASHNASNIINCNWCHNNTNRLEPFHFTNWSNGTVEAPGWDGWVNGTRANCIDCHVTNNNTAPFFAEPSSYPNWHKGVYGASLNDCYQCHSNLTVLAASDSRASVEMHNVTRFINWNDCNSCHSPKYGGAPKVDNISMSAANSMHATIDGATSSNINPACKACHGGNVSIHKNATASNCTYCHITDKLKFTTKNVSEHILNGTYANTTVNTSRYQQVFCDLCHNNSLANFNDDTPGTKNATTAHYGQNKTANKLMSSGANSTDCVYCHKNTSNMAKWGVLSTSNANISNRGDHTSYSANTVCYDCHVDSKAKPSTFHADELNQGIGSSPNCIGCHDMGSGNKKVDITATNDSSNIHKNLNSGASAGSYDSANKPCWACHGNGSATAHIDSVYKAPRICENCHINASQPYGALQVAEHYRNGSDIKATNATNNTRSCLACHQNMSEMRLANSDNDAGTFDADGDGVNGTNISAYHYGRKRAELRAGTNTSCGYCHQNSSSVFPMSDTNKSIREHTNSSTANVTNATLTCTGSKCHSQGFIHNSSLRKNTTQVWMPGSKDYCAPCHKINDANATKYVYSHNTTATPINEDCGYCHNASSQGINGSTVRVHSPALTNTTTSSIYASCTGCHNGTSLYVGSGKQILSHMPNASQYRGNTTTSSYTCEYCHNLSGKPSMHSTGMNRSNGTCNTCHFNRTSPYKSTKKIIASSDYNHTYVGQKTCAAAQCHNASNGSVFHMDKYAAGVVAEPEKFKSIWNDRYTMGFTESSYPYVDCIDCHRAPYNNSYPFNNTYPFNYSTNYSYNYESNHTGENKKTHTTADTIASCYNCHTNRTDAADRYMVHNITIEPLAGGPACIKCHNLSATGDVPLNKRVNHTALNQSVHKNLTNFTAWNNSPHKATSVLLDSACWTCHASDITNIPGNEHPDRGGPSSFKKPFQCNECHTPGGNASITNSQVYYNATKVYKHYAGKIFAGSKAFNTTKECPECHINGLLSNTNVSYSAEYKYKNEANSSHYGDRSALIDTRNNTNSYGCTQCHAAGQNGIYYGNAKIMNSNHNLMGGSQARCQTSCHNSNPGFNITLHAPVMGINVGTGACYSSGCHTAPSTGGRTRR